MNERGGTDIIHHAAIFRVDPRAKMAAAAALSIMTLKAGPIGLGVVSLGMAVVIAGEKLSCRGLYRASRPALPFVGIIFLLHSLFSDGSPLLNLAIGPLRVTIAGISLGALLAWRFVLLLAAGSLLTTTTPIADLTSGLERLLRPVCVKNVSSSDLALMVSLALRFVPTLEEEMESLKEAQAARGAEIGARGGIGKRVRAISGLALPLSLALFRRCDHLVEAIYARAYDGGSRTGLRGDFSLSAGDWTIIVLAFITGAGCFFL